MSNVTFQEAPKHLRFKAIVHQTVIVNEDHEVYLEATDEESARKLLQENLSSIPSVAACFTLDTSDTRTVTSFEEIV